MSVTTIAAAGAAPRARTLLDIFNATVARCADRVAIDADTGSLTYSDLSAAAERLAERLRKAGVGPGDRVGVRVASGTSDLYVAILGVLRSGAAYVPVDADDPPARAADLFERAGACAVVRDGLAIMGLGPALGASRPQLAFDDDAWVIFTSGSTGAPKGVAVSHRSAAAFVDAEARLWSVQREDRVLAGLSVGFDASCEEMWLAWRHGAALVPAPRSVVQAGSELGPWLAQRGVTVVSTVPTLAAMWEEGSLAGVRLIILGGEACPEQLAWRLAAGREVWNTYGPTEATVVSTAAQIRIGEPVTIGRPLDGWETAVVDEEGEPVADGEPGELVIAGVGVARYLDPVLDTERFPALPALGWERAYCTGDIVRQTAEGIAFVGRRDQQVKIGGRRIELGEIDSHLAGLPGVSAGATVVRESSAGNKLLVAYFSGGAEPAAVRAALAKRLPQALVPMVIGLEQLPQSSSGKIDRKALPWPPPRGTVGAGLAGTEAWLAEQWVEQLGPVAIEAGSDFFCLGGSSLAAAKLTSALRERYPSVAVADVYNHRRLEQLAARLDQLSAGNPAAADAPAPASRRWGAIQLTGVLALLGLAAPQWVLGVLAVGRLNPGSNVPHIGWAWLIVGWLGLVSAPGRAVIVICARRLLLGRLQAGRYPRHSWLTYRIWFVERLSEICHIDALAGTPWASRYARLAGHDVGPGARLGTLPPPTSLVTIGPAATIESEVDLHGWWLDGEELVVGRLAIGAGARVGTRALLTPGAQIGAGAEIEPGALVNDVVPSGQRWAGSPARHVGSAGNGWPQPLSPREVARPRVKAMYLAGIAIHSMLPLVASVPGIVLLMGVMPSQWTADALLIWLSALAPALALMFVVSYGLLVAFVVRAVSRLVRPGWHHDDAPVAWALWLSEAVMGSARGLLFPLFASIYTRPWLRLLGVRVGPRTEISTAVGLNRLVSFGERSFATDDVAFVTGRSRGGWLHVAPIEVGDRTFLGNSAILVAPTKIGDDALVGALSTPPRVSPNGTSWFGAPALELPRVPDAADPARTTEPPKRLIVARGLVELVRILLPGTISTVLGGLMFLSLSTLGGSLGLLAMCAAAPALLAATGALAALITVALKWLLIGRYRPGQHPLWSSFVWRDEIVNTCQEQLAGGWLLRTATATPIMPLYLRAMGATVGRDVWCESLNLTEFDVVTLERGCVINRHAVVETHLFHDRLMRIGPATVAAGATLGPATAILPDTTIGARATVGGRSVVMRGERLPPRTRWHGAPVLAV